MKQFKPMLACGIDEEDFEKIRYPLICQPKLDGIRCIVLEGKVLSRTLKPIPNPLIRGRIKNLWESMGKPYLIDGELVAKLKEFNATQSIVMSHYIAAGTDTIDYFVFDYAKYEKDLSLPYITRTADLSHFPDFLIPRYRVYSSTDLREVEKTKLSQYEGIILRDLFSPYKFGRSTLNEQYLLKFKRFIDADFSVVGFKQLEYNGNELEYNNLGYAKRSDCKEGKILLNMLGSLKVKILDGEMKGKETFLGTGFTEPDRIAIWSNRDFYLGKIGTLKYQRHGAKDTTRIPVFKGWRKELW